jgi:hypothetical protein
MDEETLRNDLSVFLEGNPKATIAPVSFSGKEFIAVTKPWGDTSLVLDLTSETDLLIPALNDVLLPERLSGIFHKDTQSLEILWTAFKLSENTTPIFGREFQFRYGGTDHHCTFKEASERAQIIAASSRPIAQSDTNYRNLPSFAMYRKAEASEKIGEDSVYGTPASFWISDAPTSEDELIQFLYHLNFYMSYYDSMSPIAIIHPPLIPKTPESADIRYRAEGAFPNSILSRSLDSEVLLFWSACLTGDPANRFLYAYRIVEHSAFYWIDSIHKASVRKILMSPHALDDIASATEKVIAAVKSSRIEDYHRIEQVVLDCADAGAMWDIVEAYIDVFSTKHIFEGGFELSPLVESVDSKKEFMNSGIRQFCNLTRKIRNALSHGKEERSAAVIAPTRFNQERLRPYAALMARVAGDVLTFQAP